MHNTNHLLAEKFGETFTIHYANSSDLRQHSFRLRHEVYCVEKRWERPHAGGLEVDSYDPYAAHFLVKHRHSATYVGTVRLVDGPHLGALPCTQHLRQQGSIAPATMARLSRRTGEISRLAIPACYRNGLGLGRMGHNKDHCQQALFILIGLVLSAIALADLKRLERIVMLTEPRARKLMRRFGLPFETISEPIALHGHRTLHSLDREHYGTGLPPPLRTFYESIRAELAERVDASPPTPIHYPTGNPRPLTPGEAVPVNARRLASDGG